MNPPDPLANGAFVPPGCAHLPVERCYWAVLDAPGFKRSGPIPPGVLDLFADEVPVPLSELHAVCAPASSGKLVVCAVHADELREIDAGTAALTPASVPEHLTGVDLMAFNLLVGTFEPRQERTKRVRAQLSLLATVALLFALTTWGLVRRTAHWNAAGSAAQTFMQSLAAGDDPSGVSIELASLRQINEVMARVRPTPDAAAALVELLTAWPTSVPCKPQSIAVSETGISISVTVTGDASAFLRAFTAPTGWQLSEPRVNSMDDVTRILLQLQRTIQGETP